MTSHYENSHQHPSHDSANQAPLCALLPEAAAFYDGALTPHRQAAFERHLADCAMCTEALADMEGVTRLMDLTPKAPLPLIWRMRATDFLREARRTAYYDAILKIAGAAVGVAAAVLLASSLWSGGAGSSGSPVRPMGNPAGWEAAAVGDSSTIETADASGPDTTTAQWVVNALDTSTPREVPSHD